MPPGPAERTDPSLCQPLRDPERHAEPVRPADDGEITAVEVRPRSSDGNVLTARRRSPAPVAVLVQVAGVVESDGLEHDADAAVDLRRRDARLEHRPDILGAGRRCYDEARNVSQDGNCVVVVEVTAEAALIAVSRHPDDHAVAIAAL